MKRNVLGADLFPSAHFVLFQLLYSDKKGRGFVILMWELSIFFSKENLLLTLQRY